MHQDNGCSAVEFIPYRCEIGVSEVVVVFSVAGEESDSISVESIEGVSDFC